MLIGKKIILRDLNYSDVDFLFHIENNEELWKYGSERKKYSKLELVNYISDANIDICIAGQYRFVIESLNKPIGFVDLFNYAIHQAEVGIIIDTPFRRKGHAKEALHLISSYAFKKLAIQHLLCSVKTTNKSSISLFYSCGFTLLQREKESEILILRNNL